jgi:hypothetical protein
VISKRIKPVTRFEYLATKIRIKFDGADFQLEVDVNQAPMNINELGKQGWELVGLDRKSVV